MLHPPPGCAPAPSRCHLPHARAAVMPFRSVSALERIPVVFLGDVIMLLDSQTVEERDAQGSDLREVPGVGGFHSGQKPVAEFQALLKVFGDRVFGGLLPGTINEEFLEGAGGRVALAERQEPAVRLRGFVPGARREGGLPFGSRGPIRTQLLARLREQEGGVSGDGWIEREIHDPVLYSLPHGFCNSVSAR